MLKAWLLSVGADHHERKAAGIRKRTYAVLNSSADDRTKLRALNDCVEFHRNTAANFPAWQQRNEYIARKLQLLTG